MIIQVTGVNTWNKGAELMLSAIKEHYSENYPHVQIVVDGHFGSFQERCHHDLKLSIIDNVFNRASFPYLLMSASQRDVVGIVRERDIDAILDASGFAFGDQHPIRRLSNFAADVKRWKSQNKRVILLPQALGPFESRLSQSIMSTVLNDVNLVFARESESYDFAAPLIENKEKLRIAPDFTCLLNGSKMEPVMNEAYSLIIPNIRMIEDARSSNAGDKYLPFLERCILASRRLAIKPVILVHGDDDESIAHDLNASISGDISIIKEESPLKIKGIIGGAEFIVASRFHALISGLSQSIPSFGTSWSHKYEMLFQEYGCPENVFSLDEPEASISDRIGNSIISESAKHQDLLRRRNRELKVLTEEMWNTVDSTLGILQSSRDANLSS